MPPSLAAWQASCVRASIEVAEVVQRFSVLAPSVISTIALLKSLVPGAAPSVWGSGGENRGHAPGEPDGDVRVPGRRHRVHLRVQGGEVVRQRLDRSEAV